MCKELQSKTVKELREYAKEIGVKSIWSYTKKADLIEAISNVLNANAELTVTSEEIAPKEIIVNKDEMEPNASDNHPKPTEAYIKTLKPGTLVAFEINPKGSNPLVLSAKFIKFVDGKSPDNGLYLITKNGDKYKIKTSRILWVKTGDRWPKWVYSKFKHNHTKTSSKEE